MTVPFEKDEGSEEKLEGFVAGWGPLPAETGLSGGLAIEVGKESPGGVASGAEGFETVWKPGGPTAILGPERIVGWDPIGGGVATIPENFGGVAMEAVTDAAGPGILGGVAIAVVTGVARTVGNELSVSV